MTTRNELDGLLGAVNDTKQPQPPPKQSTVVLQLWEESERGWGVRPDGFTLHLTMADHEKFVSDFWAKNGGDGVPDEYTRECSSPTFIMVGPMTFTKLMNAAADHGIWGDGNCPNLQKTKDGNVWLIEEKS